MPMLRAEIKSKLIEIAVKAKHHELLDKITELHNLHEWTPSYKWQDPAAYIRLCRLETSARVLKEYLVKREMPDTYMATVANLERLYG